MHSFFRTRCLSCFSTSWPSCWSEDLAFSVSWYSSSLWWCCAIVVLDNACSVTGDSRTLHVQVVKTDPLLHVSCIFFLFIFCPFVPFEFSHSLRWASSPSICHYFSCPCSNGCGCRMCGSMCWCMRMWLWPCNYIHIQTYFMSSYDTENIVNVQSSMYWALHFLWCCQW